MWKDKNGNTWMTEAELRRLVRPRWWAWLGIPLGIAAAQLIIWLTH